MFFFCFHFEKWKIFGMCIFREEEGEIEFFFDEYLRIVETWIFGSNGDTRRPIDHNGALASRRHPFLAQARASLLERKSINFIRYCIFFFDRVRAYDYKGWTLIGFHFKVVLIYFFKAYFGLGSFNVFEDQNSFFCVFKFFFNSGIWENFFFK